MEATRSCVPLTFRNRYLGMVRPSDLTMTSPIYEVFHPLEVNGTPSAGARPPYRERTKPASPW